MKYNYIYSLLLKKKFFNKVSIKNISNKHDRIKFRIENLKYETLLEFFFTSTTEEPPYIKSNFKFLIKINNKLCFIVRLDLREEHINPSFEDLPIQILKELEKLKDSNKIIKNILSLLKKYEEYHFKRDEGHIHIFIKDYEECDKWAISIKDFIKLINDINNLEVKDISFYNKIELQEKDKMIENIKNFLLLLNFNFDEKVKKQLQTFQSLSKISEE